MKSFPQLKKYYKSNISIHHEDLFRSFKSEIKILEYIHHPNIVKFIGICESLPNISIFEELLNGPNLDEYLRNEDTVHDIATLYRITKHIAKGMYYLHSINILHR